MIRDSTPPIIALDSQLEPVHYGRSRIELTGHLDESGCTLTLNGKPVEVDVTGRAHRYQPPTPQDRMILHIPEGSRDRAQVVGLPAELSSAQRATYELLVAGRQRLRE